MRTHNQIVERYVEADAEDRIFLFLECPSLRNEFIHIDLAEYRRKETVSNENGTAPARSILRWCRTAMAYCCPMFKKA